MSAASTRRFAEAGLRTVGQRCDCRLLAAAQQGDRQAAEAVLQRYGWLIGAGVREGHLHLLEREDLEQAGRIGLWEAIQAFREARGVPFSAFARLCVRREIASLLRAMLRGRLQACSLDAEAPAGRDKEGVVGRACEAAALCALAVLRAGLSRLEQDCSRLRWSGYSYDEIAAHLGRPSKAVGNALARARRKLDRAMG
jgi:RNA polymerase sporulation-specific sigma factor